MFNAFQWNCFNLVYTCNIALILFLKCDVTKLRIASPSCHTSSSPSTPPLTSDVIYGWPLRVPPKFDLQILIEHYSNLCVSCIHSLPWTHVHLRFIIIYCNILICFSRAFPVNILKTLSYFFLYALPTLTSVFNCSEHTRTTRYHKQWNCSFCSLFYFSLQFLMCPNFHLWILVSNIFYPCYSSKMQIAQFCSAIGIIIFSLLLLLLLLLLNANHIIPSCFHLPVSCRSLVDRCDSIGSCKPQIWFDYINVRLHGYLKSSSCLIYEGKVKI